MHHVKSITIQWYITVWKYYRLEHFVWSLSDKIISSSIDWKLLPYCTSIFLQQKLLSITENILLIDTQRYIDALMLNLQYQYTHWSIIRHAVLLHHGIIPSLSSTVLIVVMTTVVYCSVFISLWIKTYIITS